MTNKDRQRRLDKTKYIVSQQYKSDLSGSMSYCLCCNKANCRHTCTATQKEREEQCLCAKAYNKLARQLRQDTKSR